MVLSAIKKKLRGQYLSEFDLFEKDWYLQFEFTNCNVKMASLEKNCKYWIGLIRYSLYMIDHVCKWSSKNHVKKKKRTMIWSHFKKGVRSNQFWQVCQNGFLKMKDLNTPGRRNDSITWLRNVKPMVEI